MNIKFRLFFCRIGNQELYAIHLAFNTTNIYHLYTQYLTSNFDPSSSTATTRAMFFQWNFHIFVRHSFRPPDRGLLLLFVWSIMTIALVEIIVHTVYRILPFHSQAVTEANILYLISAKSYNTQHRTLRLTT